MKKKISVLLSCVMGITALLGMAGCKIGDWRIENEEGDFIYWWLYGNSTRILGLSEQGKMKETIIIPEKIAGKDVHDYTFETERWGVEGNLESENLKQLYIEPYVGVYMADFNCSPNLEKVVFRGGVDFLNGTKSIKGNQRGVKCYLPSWDDRWTVDEFGCIQECLIESEENVKLYITNVSFLDNFGRDKDFYYWVDIVNYGEKIENIPEDPESGQFDEFLGWYKEPECINKWDFENDTLPEPIYNEEGKELYQETRLYAKWLNKWLDKNN